MEATLDRLLEVYALLDALEKGYGISPNNEKQSDIDYEIFSEEYLALYEKILNALKRSKAETR
jgi:hypothetical protein